MLAPFLWKVTAASAGGRLSGVGCSRLLTKRRSRGGAGISLSTGAARSPICLQAPGLLCLRGDSADERRLTFNETPPEASGS